MNLQTIGGRKFLASMYAFIQTGILQWNGKINDGVYSAVMLAVVAAFIVGNVAQYHVERNKEAS